MDGFERSLAALVNRILPQTKDKDKEQIAGVLPYWLIVLNILGILLLASEAAKDGGGHAAFYVTGVAMSALMIVGALLRTDIVWHYALIVGPLVLLAVVGLQRVPMLQGQTASLRGHRVPSPAARQTESAPSRRLRIRPRPRPWIAPCHAM